jgi:uncharacterized membrane protein YbhN (UPF0104 family)
MLRLLGHRISGQTAFSLVMAAWPVASVTPSKSGDLIKAYYLKDAVPPSLTLGTVLAERAADVLVLLALSTAGAAWLGWGRVLWISGIFLAAGLVAVAVLVTAGTRWLRSEKWRTRVEDLLRAFRVLIHHPGALGLVVAYTILKWLVSIVQAYLCFMALGRTVSLAQTAAALPLAIFVGLIPITISGVGTRDGALIVLFRQHAPAEVSLGVGLLYTLLAYWLPSLAGLPFLRRAMPKGVVLKDAISGEGASGGGRGSEGR